MAAPAATVGRRRRARVRRPTLIVLAGSLRLDLPTISASLDNPTVVADLVGTADAALSIRLTEVARIPQAFAEYATLVAKGRGEAFADMRVLTIVPSTALELGGGVLYTDLRADSLSGWGFHVEEYDDEAALALLLAD